VGFQLVTQKPTPSVRSLLFGFPSLILRGFNAPGFSLLSLNSDADRCDVSTVCSKKTAVLILYAERPALHETGKATRCHIDCYDHNFK
jgi:hypothetical protein